MFGDLQKKRDVTTTVQVQVYRRFPRPREGISCNVFAFFAAEQPAAMKFSAEIVLNAIEDAFESMFELLMPVDLNDDIQPTKAKAKGEEWETFDEDTIAQEKLQAYEEMLTDGAAGAEPVLSTAQPQVEEARKAAPEKQAKKARKQQGNKKSPKAAAAATTRVAPKKLQAGGHKGKAKLRMAPVAKAVRV